MLYFLLISPTVQLYTSAGDSKGVGTHSLKPFCKSLFSSSVAFLVTSVASQKHRPFHSYLTWGKAIYQLQTYHTSMGNVPVLSHRSLLRNPWPKPTGVLEHCREGEIDSQFFLGGRGFLSTASPTWQRASMYKNVPHAAIPVNYTSEFRKSVEATTQDGRNYPPKYAVVMVINIIYI
jgi:hypothetical protein